MRARPDSGARPNSDIIPAKARIQNRASQSHRIPAFAGMTRLYPTAATLSPLALGQPRHFFFAASAASRAVSFSYEALSKLPPEPFATSRTTAQVVL